MPTIVMYDVGTPCGQPSSLTVGALIADGKTAGRVCFSNPQQLGTYVASFGPRLQPQAGGQNGLSRCSSPIQARPLDDRYAFD